MKIMKNNDILKDYIIKKYGSISKFLKKEKFSHQDLETVLQKKDIFREIGIAIKICRFLNIDTAKLFCRHEIFFLENEKDNASEDLNKSSDDIIKEKYAKLNEEDRKKALDFADHIFENGI